jgi:predicted DNA-binding transcriptional regulator AlpA
MAERIRPAEVARMTSLSVRQVQQMAAANKIPSAAKIGTIWTFDPIRVRAWIKQLEQRQWQADQPTYTGAATSGGDVSRLPDASIAEAFARLIPRRRGFGSRGGGKSSNAPR